METKYFNRGQLKFYSLKDRTNQIAIEKERVVPIGPVPILPEEAMKVIRQTAVDIIKAKQKEASRILTFGSHVIRNGLGPLLGEFVQRGWLTHLATTGTSVVDDWEFAYQATACEDTKTNLPKGCFGLWQESGLYINLAIVVGAWRGYGFGEAVGKMISHEGILLPQRAELMTDIDACENLEKAAAAADLLNKMDEYDLSPGWNPVPSQFREFSLQYIAQKTGIPFTVHPMFGLDVFFMHPVNSFAAVGRVAERDFLYFVSSVDNLENGVYLSVGSSIASPMIFEKALSMSQNVRIPQGHRMTRHKIVVVDLAESKWNWMTNGEPPEDRPEYYLRYCKSFSRAKAETMYYVSADNRDFFLVLYDELNKLDRA